MKIKSLGFARKLFQVGVIGYQFIDMCFTEVIKCEE